MYFVHKIVGWVLSPLGMLFLGCALGALVCCLSELMLLAIAAALMLNGTIGEERVGAAGLAAAWNGVLAPLLKPAEEA